MGHPEEWRSVDHAKVRAHTKERHTKTDEIEKIYISTIQTNIFTGQRLRPTQLSSHYRNIQWNIFLLMQ